QRDRVGGRGGFQRGPEQANVAWQLLLRKGAGTTVRAHLAGRTANRSSGWSGRGGEDSGLGRVGPGRLRLHAALESLGPLRDGPAERAAVHAGNGADPRAPVESRRGRAVALPRGPLRGRARVLPRRDPV